MFMANRNFSVCLAAVLIGSAWFSACQPRDSKPVAMAIAKTNQSFQVKGVVQAVKPEKRTVRIKHEAIPDYMPAMTMDFDVKDAQELKDLKAGDTVTFRMVVTENEGWIDQIKRIETAPVEAAAPVPAELPASFDLLQVGDPVPNYHFTNELGRAVSLQDWRGKAIAITFIFTRCPFPEACPRLSKNFSDAYQKLKARADAPANWKLLSISFDTEFDTAAVLKAYAQRYQYDPAEWSFLTGSMENIGGLAAQAGLQFGREGQSISHNFRTVVIDARGRLHQIFSDNRWTADELVTALIQAAHQQ